MLKSNTMSPKPATTTDEIMDFLREHMVTKEEFYVLAGRVGSVEGKVDKLEGKVDRLEDEVFGIKEQLGTFATKEDMDDMKGEILTVMDGFAKRQTTFEVELFALRNWFDRFEGFPAAV